MIQLLHNLYLSAQVLKNSMQLPSYQWSTFHMDDRKRQSVTDCERVGKGELRLVNAFAGEPVAVCLPRDKLDHTPRSSAKNCIKLLPCHPESDSSGVETQIEPHTCQAP